MKKSLSLFCAIAIVGGIVVACDGGEEGMKLIDIPFEEYSLNEVSFKADFYDAIQDGEVIILNSDEDMTNYFEEGYPPVDFSGQTLLLASGRTSTAVHSSIIGAFQKVSTNKYLLSIELGMTVATVPDVWIIGLVSDKLSENAEIELKIIKN